MKLLSLRSVGWINVALPLMAAPKSLPSDRTEPQETTERPQHTNTHTAQETHADAATESFRSFS